MVANEEDFSAPAEFLLQEALNVRNYAAGFSPAVQGITLLQETPEHVNN